ncbi:MAG TPA: acyclic terpene utilization AtuA family protein, partial [Acidobacteriota bacterium]|nr:acyclic terpene utilization AtuA family protein [Acidobacteriota bacterium]
MKTIRIGGALGYWGDRSDALLDLLRGGPLDYVILDYLAEVTMSILQKQRSKNAGLGYPHDFVPLIKQALPLLRRSGVRLVADAGGLNPMGLAEALVEVARETGYPELKIGVVHGDDLMPHLEDYARQGIEFRHFDTLAPQSDIPGRNLSANAYLGAFPIAEALNRGADLVITGRVNDAALALGPLIHEFGWRENQYDLLARGTIAGHLLECGGQASGGNFNGGWQNVPDLANLGFPIGEISDDGTLIMTIHPRQGGLVTPAVLKEQLLYEIGDPAAYIVADVVCDITEVEMQNLENNRVKVWGTRGRPPTASYKVSMSYEGGYQVSVGLVYTW